MPAFNNGRNVEEPNSIEQPIQVGYIYFPKGVGSWEEFEQRCRQTKTYSVYLERGAIKHNCPVSSFFAGGSDGQIRAFAVPKKAGLLGERVLLFFPCNSDIPIIGLSVPGGNSNTIAPNENSNYSTIHTEEVTIDFGHDAKAGTYDINVSAEKSDKEVAINLNVASKTKKGKIRLNVNGACEIYTEDKLEVISNNSVEMKLRDEVAEPNKLSQIIWKFLTGFLFLDKWTNKIQINASKIDVYSVKDIFVTAERNIKLYAKSDIIVDTEKANQSIHLGNNASYALNEDCICQYTGQRHLKPPTNNKTKL